MALSDKIYSLCRSKDSISSEVEASTALTPFEAAKKLYGETKPEGTHRHPHHSYEYTAESLKRVRECGSWGESEPSELFLKVYHDVLCTLEEDPLASMVSPSMLGTTGVIPLTIISTIPDICRHMSNLIARAETEVFLATNYWADSQPTKLISDGLRELSRRAGERGQTIPVRLMYDRGDLKQFIKNHQPVFEAGWTAKAINLPPQSEIPHIKLDIINYHRPALGTFHAKYAIIDRKIAVTQSNNIQDNDNLEMMVQLEGPIVKSLNEVAMLSWSAKFDVPLPNANDSADVFPSFSDPSFVAIFNADGTVKGYNQKPWHELKDNKYPYSKAPGPEGTDIGAVLHDQTSTEPSQQEQTLPVQPSQQSATTTAPADAAQGDSLLPEHNPGDNHFDPTIAAQLARSQSSARVAGHGKIMQTVTKRLNTSIQPNTVGDAPECPPHDEMTAFLPHSPHEPFPIAIVCRKPYGNINNLSVYTPQNEAWLSAVHNAKSTIFIQTPDLNAKPLLPALQAAAKRGVQVYMYTCLGYNDAGELLPGQGGTNEMAANTMYTALDGDEAARQRLHVYYYTAKDMTKPIHNSFKQRSCHIKIMIVDSHVGIQGSGNQDTQSWFHSQEINVMVDSERICLEWIEALRRNQNTAIYGRSADDGCWRDSEGNMAPGAMGYDVGRFSWAKGIVGAINRARGAGGF